MQEVGQRLLIIYRLNFFFVRSPRFFHCVVHWHSNWKALTTFLLHIPTNYYLLLIEWKVRDLNDSNDTRTWFFLIRLSQTHTHTLSRALYTSKFKEIFQTKANPSNKSTVMSACDVYVYMDIVKLRNARWLIN